MNAPLRGIRVLDVTHAVSAPSATKLLADLGAEVWKIEAPSGDFIRAFSPVAFGAYNLGKQSATINLKDPDGQETLRRLVEVSDVFVESQRPGLLDSFGLGRERLRSINPRLIHASLTGYGETGPESGRKGVDGVVQALTGMAALQGKIMPNIPIVDLAAGLSLHAGILAALYRRERYGVGDAIDVNLLDTAMYLQAVPIAEYRLTGTMRSDVEHARRFAPLGDYDAADGRLYVGAITDRDWQALCEALDRDDLASDPRFATRSSRTENWEAIRAAVGEEITKRSRDSCVEALESRGVMAAPFLTYAEVLESPQVAHNGMFADATLTDGSTAQLPRAPYRLASIEQENADPLASRVAPQLGAATDDVLKLIDSEAASQNGSIGYAVSDSR